MCYLVIGFKLSQGTHVIEKVLLKPSVELLRIAKQSPVLSSCMYVKLDLITVASTSFVGCKSSPSLARNPQDETAHNMSIAASTADGSNLNFFISILLLVINLIFCNSIAVPDGKPRPLCVI